MTWLMGTRSKPQEILAAGNYLYFLCLSCLQDIKRRISCAARAEMVSAWFHLKQSFVVVFMCISLSDKFSLKKKKRIILMVCNSKTSHTDWHNCRYLNGQNKTVLPGKAVTLFRVKQLLIEVCVRQDISQMFCAQAAGKT